VKAGLVTMPEQYFFSSASFYLLQDDWFEVFKSLEGVKIFGFGVVKELRVITHRNGGSGGVRCNTNTGRMG
jgi:hypothetical protein